MLNNNITALVVVQLSVDTKRPHVLWFEKTKKCNSGICSIWGDAPTKAAKNDDGESKDLTSSIYYSRVEVSSSDILLLVHI